MAPDTLNLLPRAEEATRLIKALAHPERLMICCQLRDGEFAVGQIERILDIPQPRLSRELSKLRADDVVGTRRESKTIFYHLKDDRIRAIVDTLCAVMLNGDAAART
ncbi:MAG: metalloregulator ArsR/SmtB family transcription factor [Henriciella sp.]|jgi:DNA-binding transcriptional ArsR family regulator